MKKRSTHWLVWTGVVVLIILALIVGTLWMIGVPNGWKLSGLLQDTLNLESFDADLTLSSISQDNKLEIQAEVFRRTSDNTVLHGITVNGIPLYFANHRVIFDNGRAFDLGKKIPEDAFRTDRLLKMLPFAGVKTESKGDDTVYFFKLDSSKLHMVFPDLSDTAALEAKFTENAGALSQLHILFNDGTQQIEMTLCFVPERHRDLSPDVWNAIIVNNPQTLEVFAPLVNALIGLSKANPLGAELAVTADCGPIALTDTMMLYGTDNGLYLQREGEVNHLETMDFSDLALIGLGYKFCRDGRFSCVGTSGSYSLQLPAESVKACCIEILPEIEILPITYDDGSLIFEVKDNSLFEMKLDVSGRMPFLVTTIDIALGAALHPIPSDQLELPEAVQ